MVLRSVALGAGFAKARSNERAEATRRLPRRPRAKREISPDAMKTNGPVRVFQNDSRTSNPSPKRARRPSTSAVLDVSERETKRFSSARAFIAIAFLRQTEKDHVRTRTCSWGYTKTMTGENRARRATTTSPGEKKHKQNVCRRRRRERKKRSFSRL